MGGENNPRQPELLLEENLKKALTELFLLHLLSQREYFIGELTDTLKEKSGGALSIVFPYAAVYRLLEAEYIIETKKRPGPDGRRRQYYAITEQGRKVHALLLKTYGRLAIGIEAVLKEGDIQ